MVTVMRITNKVTLTFENEANIPDGEDLHTTYFTFHANDVEYVESYISKINDGDTKCHKITFKNGKEIFCCQELYKDVIYPIKQELKELKSI